MIRLTKSNGGSSWNGDHECESIGKLKNGFGLTQMGSMTPEMSKVKPNGTKVHVGIRTMIVI